MHTKLSFTIFNLKRQLQNTLFIKWHWWKIPEHLQCLPIYMKGMWSVCCDWQLCARLVEEGRRVSASLGSLSSVWRYCHLLTLLLGCWHIHNITDSNWRWWLLHNHYYYVMSCSNHWHSKHWGMRHLFSTLTSTQRSTRCHVIIK